MTFLYVKPHPLGVIVSADPKGLGMLLIPDEGCCGISFDQLKHVANTTRQVDIDAAIVETGPLRMPTLAC